MRALPKVAGFVCGVPSRYGGLSAARKYSRVEFGLIWKCNRRVKIAGERCWQHKEK